MAIGVYELRNDLTGNRLIIGSTQIKSSIKKHRENLYYGIHENSTFQNDYESNWTRSPITTVVLIACTRHELERLEQQYLIAHKNDPSIFNDRNAQGEFIGYAKADLMRLRDLKQASGNI